MAAHILVVDDHDLLRDGFRFLLESEGYQVTTAAGGQQALDLIARERPDAVLTDLKMPGMDGWELRRRLLVECPTLPVIAMTSDPDLIRDARIRLMNGSLLKPFHIDDLLHLLPTVLQAAA